MLDSLGSLAPALARWMRMIEMLRSGAIEFVSRRTVLFAIVAFSQAPVMENRDRGIAEGDLGCLDGAPEIGGEDDSDSIVPPAFPEVSGKQAPLVGQATVMPASGVTVFVVFGEGMSLKHDLDGHVLVSAEVRASNVGRPPDGSAMSCGPAEEPATPTKFAPS
jgi:hypothetical protein